MPSIPSSRVEELTAIFLMSNLPHQVQPEEIPHRSANKGPDNARAASEVANAIQHGHQLTSFAAR